MSCTGFYCLPTLHTAPNFSPHCTVHTPHCTLHALHPTSPHTAQCTLHITDCTHCSQLLSTVPPAPNFSCPFCNCLLKHCVLITVLLVHSYFKFFLANVLSLPADTHLSVVFAYPLFSGAGSVCKVSPLYQLIHT